MSKKIIYSSMSIFLTYISVSHFYYITQKVEIMHSLEAFFQAIYFSFCLTGIFAFVGLVFPLYDLMPEKYYVVKNSKTIRFFYNYLKVDWFGYFLTKTFYKPQSKRTTFFNGKKSGIKNFLDKTKESEFAHFFPLLLLFFAALYFFSKEQISFAFFLILVNIFLNFYPIILQRYHRVRVSKVLKK